MGLFNSDSEAAQRSARALMRRAALLFTLLLAQVVLAAEAQATNWVVNVDNSGYNPIPLGGTIVYSITVENEDLASNTAPANTIILDVPDTATFTGGTGTITNCRPIPLTGPAQVTCDIAALPGGTTATLQASVRTSASGTIILRAEVPTLGIDTQPANNVVLQPTTVTDGTDIDLDITGPDSAASGSTATYTFTARNLGPLTASNLVITFPAPTGLHAIVVPAGCVFTAPNYVCTIAGPVAAGSSAGLTLTGQISAGSSSTVTVAGSLTSSSPPDPIPFNNTATKDTTVTAGSDLRISKTRSPSGTLLVGGNATFTLAAAYTGEEPVDITITDDVPANFQIDTVTPLAGSGWTCTVAGQTVTCTLPRGSGTGANIPLGSIAIATTILSGGSATNTARIDAASPPDPNPANNTATDGGTVIQDRVADLRANKSGPSSPALVVVGQSYNFAISTTNLGNQPFAGTLVMTDSLPAGLQLTTTTANGWTCTPGPVVDGPVPIVCERTYTDAVPLASGATTPAVTLRTLVTATGTISNSMTVTSPDANYPDPNLANNTIVNTVGSTASAAAADVEVIKTAASASVASGSLQTFSIQIINNGPSPSANVTLTDDVTQLIDNVSGSGLDGYSILANAPPGMTCALAPLGGATGTSGRLTCTLPTLPVCTRDVDCPAVSLSVRPGGNGGSRTNSARAVSSTVGDPNIANNTGSAVFAITPSANVTVSKAVTPANPIAGQPFTYIIAAVNPQDGRSSAGNVTITDTLPAGLVFLEASASQGSCSTAPAVNSVTGPGNTQLVCNLGTLPDNSQQTVSVRLRPTTALRNTTITNSVDVTSTTPDDIDEPSFELQTPIANPSLDLQVNKSDNPDPISVGETTVYTLTATNNGRSAAENVVVTDVLPTAGLVYLSSSVPADGSCSLLPVLRSSGGTLACSFPLLRAGESRSISVTMEAVSNGVFTNAVQVASDETVLGFDTDAANNQDAEATTVRTRVDLVLSKTASSPSVALLEPFSFTIGLTNSTGSGLTEAENVQITDTLPAGMQLTAQPSASFAPGVASANTCTGAAGGTAFTCSFGVVANGGVITVTVPVRVAVLASSPQSFTNTATAQTTSLEVDTSNNTASAQVSVGAASLAGMVFRDFNGNGSQGPGDTGIAGVAMRLTGQDTNGAAVDVTVNTAADGGYLFAVVPPGTYTVTRGPVAEAGLIDGLATVGSAGGTVQGSTVISGITLASQAATAYDFALVPSSGIAISKSLLAGPVVRLDGSFTVSFLLTASNPSLEALDNVVVTDQLAGPAPLFGTYAASPVAPGTYGLAAPLAGSCGGINPGFDGSAQPVAASGFSLAAGASCTVEISLAVMPTNPLPPLLNGGRYFNQASISGTGSLSGGNAAAVSERVPVAPELPRLAIAKAMTGHQDADGNGKVTEGDLLTFTVTATNSGSAVLTGVVVTDNRITPESTTCPVLQPGGACVLTGTYTVTIADVQAGSVVNTATADSNETDPVTATVTTPVVAVIDKNTLTKTALVSTAKRGEKVPYVIEAQGVPFNPARIVDVMPPGFAFIAGSATANGQKVAPAVDGRRITFDGLVPDAGGDIKLELTLVATATVNPGVSVNQAQLVSPATGAVVATARARVTILAEAVFDCGDIIGKVFDDWNRNGYQDDGEPGLPAVRVATVHGLLVTTDPEGRFNIPCADIPDADIGSNFILKLDTRTLPTGYHVTTENPRRVRLTRGKVVKLNFGASLSRLVRLELNGKVFAPGTSALLPKWEAGLDRLVTALQAESSVLEITYRGSDGTLARSRLRAVKQAVAQRWSAVPGHYDLAIDTRIVSGGAQ